MHPFAHAGVSGGGGDRKIPHDARGREGGPIRFASPLCSLVLVNGVFLARHAANKSVASPPPLSDGGFEVIRQSPQPKCVWCFGKCGDGGPLFAGILCYSTAVSRVVCGAHICAAVFLFDVGPRTVPDERQKEGLAFLVLGPRSLSILGPRRSRKVVSTPLRFRCGYVGSSG